MKDVEFQRRQRRALVVGEWLTGMSIRQIAHRHQLPDYTVRRILRTTPEVQAEHANRQAAQERDHITQLRHQLHTWSLANPGAPLHVAAEHHGTSTSTVRELLGGRAGLHTGRQSTPVITDAQIITAIQTHLTATRDPRAATYATAAKTHDWPSLSTITARYGSWRNALTAAGHPITAGHGRPRRWSDEQLLTIVRTYLTDADHPHWTDLDAWLKASSDRPSSSLVRKRLGTWAHLVAQCEAQARDTP